MMFRMASSESPVATRTPRLQTPMTRSAPCAVVRTFRFHPAGNCAPALGAVSICSFMLDWPPRLQSRTAQSLPVVGDIHCCDFPGTPPRLIVETADDHIGQGRHRGSARCLSG